MDALLDEPFGNWHVDTTTQSHQVRVTKKGEALLHTAERGRARSRRDRDHDRDKGRLLPEDDPVFVALGLSDHEGRMKPSRQAKYRQVEEFLRILDASITDAIDKGHLRRPTDEEPLRMADLGCGNGYLTVRGPAVPHPRPRPARRGRRAWTPSSSPRDHNTAVADRTRPGGGLRASPASPTVELTPAPEVVLALHACDTATDDALARAVAWESPLVLAAPCCHHDIAAQWVSFTAVLTGFAVSDCGCAAGAASGGLGRAVRGTRKAHAPFERYGALVLLRS